MPIIGAIGAAAAGGGRYINVKPTMTYNTYPGVFNITNADSTANYSSFSSVNTGSLSFGSGNSTVTLSNANSVATVLNRSVKGVTSSPSTLAERKQFSYTYVTAPPPATGTCYNYSAPGGTRYGGYWMAFYGSPYTYLNPAPGYTAAPSEWYKIT
jgi:hypothetical protein